MINYRWTTLGTLDEICAKLHLVHFPPKIFLIISRGEGWYQIDNDTWLMVKVSEHDWQLCLWNKGDPRPFIRNIAQLNGIND